MDSDVVSIDFGALGKSVGVPIKTEEVHGRKMEFFDWTLSHAKQALDRIKELAGLGKTVEFISHPTNWLFCAAAEACEKCGYYMSIPAINARIDVPILKTGAAGDDPVANYEITEHGDNVLVRAALKGDAFHMPLEDMGKLVPVTLPAGKNVFLKCDGVAVLSVFWYRAYAQTAKSVWVTENEREFYCVYSKTPEYEPLSVMINPFTKEHV